MILRLYESSVEMSPLGEGPTGLGVSVATACESRISKQKVSRQSSERVIDVPETTQHIEKETRINAKVS